jgi:hypothetical protein
MWWSYWPTPWVFLAPLMMLACMAGMFFMMRAMDSGHHPTDAGEGLNLGPNVPARFPDGQSAFEDYRAETLRRLNNEQQEFQAFLGRLRTAKDRAEFEQFMAERRTGTSSPA